MEELVRKTALNSENLECIDKFPRDYNNKVFYLEDPFFFNDWYGFMYYHNKSEKIFQIEKRFGGCIGHKVISHDVDPKTEIISLEPEEQRIYILKRTLDQCNFIPTGKVLPSPDI